MQPSPISVRALAALAARALAPAAGAQYEPPRRELQLSGFAGYQLNGDVSTSGGNLVIDDSPSYGASLGWAVAPGSTAELLWIYTNTNARFSGFSGYSSSESFGLPVNYFQIGGTHGIRRGNLEPYLGGTLGAMLASPGQIRFLSGSTVTPGATWRFAFTLGGGMKIHFSPVVALRLDVRMLAPVYFSSGGVYAGTGGAGLAVSGGIPSLQWAFTGGLTFSP